MKIVFYEKGNINVVVGASELKGNLTIEQIQNEGEKQSKDIGRLLRREIGYLLDMNGKLETSLGMD